MQHLKQSILKRRGKGLDIHILVGHPDDKTTDLAPDAGAEQAPMDEAHSQHPIADMHKKLAEGENGDDGMQDAMMGDMSDHDKMSLHKPGAAKSLGQKARLAALLHKK